MKYKVKTIVILLLSIIATYNLMGFEKYNQSTSVVIDNKLNNYPLVQVPAFSGNNEIYISLNDFVNKTGFGIYTNESEQKSVLYVANDKVTFTANNNFVILNDHMYQLVYIPLWKDAELWVPVKMLVDLFTNYTSQIFSFDSNDLIFTLGMKDVNLTGLEIDARDNGTLIKIKSRKKFTKGDIQLKVTNGRFHIDVFGGKIDAGIFKNYKSSGVISEIDVIEFEG